MDCKKILAELSESGVSQESIAKEMGHSQGWVSKLSRGDIKNMRWDDGEKLKRLHKKHAVKKGS